MAFKRLLKHSTMSPVKREAKTSFFLLDNSNPPSEHEYCIGFINAILHCLKYSSDFSRFTRCSIIAYPVRPRAGSAVAPGVVAFLYSDTSGDSKIIIIVEALSFLSFNFSSKGGGFDLHSFISQIFRDTRSSQRREYFFISEEISFPVISPKGDNTSHKAFLYLPPTFAFLR